MKGKQRFFICEICGNLVGLISEEGAALKQARQRAVPLGGRVDSF